MNSPRQNNFNLIRLIAAIQVMLFHGLTYFKPSSRFAETIEMLVYSLPGVPIFFTISGFLIYQSLERNGDNLKKYFINRLVRIYPALWVCLIFTIVLILSSEGISSNIVKTNSFIAWFLAQISVFQFYKIPELGNWGVGHPNGSLWSISVEVQFYFFLPLLFLFYKGKRTLRFKNLSILIIIILSVIYNYIQTEILDQTLNSVKLLGLFLPQYLYFFCFGVLIHLNFNSIKKFLINKAWFWISLFILFTFIFKGWLDVFENVYETSFLGLIGAVILALTTISAAYTKPRLSETILKDNDISYGIYIYHMPIFNYFYHQQTPDSWPKLIGLFLGVVLMAYLSWTLIEKNSLKLKSRIN